LNPLKTLASFLSIAATVALLSGCSGSGIATPGAGAAVQQSAADASSRRQPVQPLFLSAPDLSIVPHAGVRTIVHAKALAAATTAIAVAVGAEGAVHVYDPSGNLLAQLGVKFPQGLASDIKGDLFVGDTQGSAIDVFARGFQSPPTIISDSGWFPVAVDSFNNGQYVAAANVFSTNDGQGSVTIFKNGTLQSTVMSSALVFPYFVAFDAVGNLYCLGLDSNRFFSVGVIANATSGGTTFSQLTTGNAPRSPSGIQVTRKGNIAILDGVNSVMYTYGPPVNGSLGSPISTTPLNGADNPDDFAFTSNMTHFYLGQGQVVNEYAYPAGGNIVSSFLGSQAGHAVTGIAVFPPEYPKVKK